MSTDKDTLDALESGERDRLLYTIETRFAPHREQATAGVREAERALADVQRQLDEAVAAEARSQYRSDPLVFMRAGVKEEVEGLERKTNPKKVRTAYRFLLDRAVELAAGEVRGYHEDCAREQRERERGVTASRAALQRAEETLDAARAMGHRVRQAEDAARKALDVLMSKLDASG